ncbi:unnamed protein product [Trichogramma brassicae]|uniref:Uncharacterized protein n=1 Tax=Trichogramma brassicae TaxID=86971 RepID=A0A6H5I2S8_9HYME|nr:unnamed protein product [Trichogramma brassicae]
MYSRASICISHKELSSKKRAQQRRQTGLGDAFRYAFFVLNFTLVVKVESTRLTSFWRKCTLSLSRDVAAQVLFHLRISRSNFMQLPPGPRSHAVPIHIRSVYKTHRSLSYGAIVARCRRPLATVDTRFVYNKYITRVRQTFQCRASSYGSMSIFTQLHTVYQQCSIPMKSFEVLMKSIQRNFIAHLMKFNDFSGIFEKIPVGDVLTFQGSSTLPVVILISRHGRTRSNAHDAHSLAINEYLVALLALHALTRRSQGVLMGHVTN